jgi:hypothetical protein
MAGVRMRVRAVTGKVELVVQEEKEETRTRIWGSSKRRYHQGCTVHSPPWLPSRVLTQRQQGH